jgi:chromate transport protein ChrA
VNTTTVITQISSADLLQADVTIVAGVLVFLTISIFYEKGLNVKTWEEPLLWVAIMPIAFIISAALLLLSSLDPTNSEFYWYAVAAFGVGLGIVMISTLVIIGVLLKNKKKKQQEKKKQKKLD